MPLHSTRCRACKDAGGMQAMFFNRRTAKFYLRRLARDEIGMKVSEARLAQ